MKKNLPLLCVFACSMITCIAQETTEPVQNNSNRIILHFDDTTGIFTQLGKLFIDRGYDIEFKDREFGILRTRPTIYYTRSNFLPEIKSIFRDSTVTLYAQIVLTDFSYVVRYTTKKGFIFAPVHNTWMEMMQIAEKLKPKTITYANVKQGLDR